MRVLEHSAIGGVAAKVGATLGVGVLAALLLAAVSREQMTRREVAYRAACAAVGSSIYGDAAVGLLAKSFAWYDPATMTVGTWLLVGALSWGAFGVLAELQTILRERGAKAIADRLLGKGDK